MPVLENTRFIPLFGAPMKECEYRLFDDNFKYKNYLLEYFDQSVSGVSHQRALFFFCGCENSMSLFLERFHTKYAAVEKTLHRL